MNQNEIPTPKTDEFEVDAQDTMRFGLPESKWVNSDFARTLERENVQLREALAKYASHRTDCSHYKEGLGWHIDKLCREAGQKDV